MRHPKMVVQSLFFLLVEGLMSFWGYFVIAANEWAHSRRHPELQSNSIMCTDPLDKPKSGHFRYTEI